MESYKEEDSNLARIECYSCCVAVSELVSKYIEEEAKVSESESTLNLVLQQTNKPCSGRFS